MAPQAGRGKWPPQVVGEVCPPGRKWEVAPHRLVGEVDPPGRKRGVAPHQLVGEVGPPGRKEEGALTGWWGRGHLE